MCSFYKTLYFFVFSIFPFFFSLFFFSFFSRFFLFFSSSSFFHALCFRAGLKDTVHLAEHVTWIEGEIEGSGLDLRLCFGLLDVTLGPALEGAGP